MIQSTALAARPSLQYCHMRGCIGTTDFGYPPLNCRSLALRGGLGYREVGKIDAPIPEVNRGWRRRVC